MKKIDDTICTCCHIRKKKKGFKYLCLICWKKNINNSGDDYYSLNFPNDIKVYHENVSTRFI